jgi:hypothetical protein
MHHNHFKNIINKFIIIGSTVCLCLIHTYYFNKSNNDTDVSYQYFPPTNASDNAYIIKCIYCSKIIQNMKSYHMFDNIFCSLHCINIIYKKFNKLDIINNKSTYVIINKCKINIDIFRQTNEQSVLIH